VDITVGGYELLAQGTLNRVGLQYCGPNNSFVEPVLTNATEILPYDEVAIVYRPLYRPNQPIDSAL
jgi:hypothetical protein